MNIFQRIRSWFITTERDVVNFAMDVWNELPILAKRIRSAANWIDTKGIPAVQAQMDTVQPYLNTIGVVSGHPEISAALNNAHIAIDKAVAFKDVVKSGNISPDQVVEAFGKVKAAEAAVATVFATASNVVAVTPWDNPPKIVE